MLHTTGLSVQNRVAWFKLRPVLPLGGVELSLWHCVRTEMSGASVWISPVCVLFYVGFPYGAERICKDYRDGSI